MEVQIIDEIGGWGFDLESLTGQLRGFRSNEIAVPINAYGGSAFESLAIYNTLRGRSERVEVHSVGYAMSMGSVIAMTGDEAVMPGNGYLMLHHPWTIALGDVKDIQHEAAVLEMLIQGG